MINGWFSIILAVTSLVAEVTGSDLCCCGLKGMPLSWEGLKTDRMPELTGQGQEKHLRRVCFQTFRIEAQVGVLWWQQCAGEGLLKVWAALLRTVAHK